MISATMYHNSQSEVTPKIANIELIEVNGSLQHDAMENLIAPYKAEKEESMSVIIGESEKTITVGKPESKLTNLIADILLTEARKYIADTDMAVTNIGGIRRPLYEGNITIGDVFEILPFDNSLLVFAKLVICSIDSSVETLTLSFFKTSLQFVLLYLQDLRFLLNIH